LTSKTVSPTQTTTYTLTATNSAGSATARTTITVNPGSDTQPPTVPTGLSANVVSASQINLSWTPASDNVGVAGYKIYRGGGQIAAVTSGTSYQDTGLSPATAYTYTVSAFDAAGNASNQSSAASATTKAPSPFPAPSVFLTSPANNQTVSGTITISVSAADNVASVQFKLDGENLGPEETSSPYSLSWDTTGTANGSHLLTAVARDAAGNTTTSSGVSVEVSNNSGGGGSSGGGSAGSSGGGGGGGFSSPRRLMALPWRLKSSFCKPFGIGISCLLPLGAPSSSGITVPLRPSRRKSASRRAFECWFRVVYGRWWVSSG